MLTDEAKKRLSHLPFDNIEIQVHKEHIEVRLWHEGVLLNSTRRDVSFNEGDALWLTGLRGTFEIGLEEIK